MTTRRTLVTGILSLACCSILAVSTFSSRTAAARPEGELLAVVVSKDSAVQNLTSYQLKQIYLGEALQTPDGKRFLPLNRGQKTKERIGFDYEVLGMSPDVAMRHWLDQRTRGKTGSPKAVDPASVVQKLVERLPGAISYVKKSDLTPNVKVISIDGKKPGDAGYTIRAVDEKTSANVGFD